LPDLAGKAHSALPHFLAGFKRVASASLRSRGKFYAPAYTGLPITKKGRAGKVDSDT